MKAKDLKNSILQMAVEGKLVPQDPADEPASALLERIREERRKLIAEKKIKAPKVGESIIYKASDGSRYEKFVDAKGRESEPVCIDEEIPFNVPEGWEWARLGSIADVKLGKMLDKQKNAGELKPYLRNANVQWGYFDLNEVHSMALSKDEQARFLLQQGDLMVCEGGDPGRCAIWGSRSCEMYYQKALHRVRCASDSLEVEYCAIVVEYSVRARLLESKMTGTTIKHLPARNLERMLVPLPPLAEQKRIAERVTELMPLVEQYGSLEDERGTLDAGLPERLRKSILQEAVRGRLVPQDPAGEPASALLERIRAERAAKVASGGLKAPKGGESVIYRASDGAHYEKCGKAEPVCIEDEIPFDVPDGWEWARLESLGLIVGGGTPKTGDSSLWSDRDEGIPWLTPADMKHVRGKYVEHGERYISQKGLASSSSQLMPKDSVLMSSRAPIGYLAISANNIATNQGFKSVVPAIPALATWLYSAIEGRMEDIKERATGTTFKEISGSEFGRTLVPIPPLDEQRRIVAKVEKLTALTNQLPR